MNERMRSMENHFNCIYMYTNKITGKRYVGKAENFLRRHKEHFNNAHNPKSSEYDTPFHRSIRKRTNHNFKKYEEIYIVEILEENLALERLGECEIYYIVELDLLAKNGKGYNVAEGGNGGNTLAGKTEEELAERSKKISEKNKKYWDNMSEEEKERFKESRRGENNPNWGKHYSEERLEKMSERMTGENNPMYGKIGENHPNWGKHYSEEARKKMRENHPDVSGEKNPMYSKKHTEEALEKMSGKNHPQARKTRQKDLNGNIIKIWDYAKQISKELGFNYNTLIDHISGRQKGKPYKGYIWEYCE